MAEADDADIHFSNSLCEFGGPDWRAAILPLIEQGSFPPGVRLMTNPPCNMGQLPDLWSVAAMQG